MAGEDVVGIIACFYFIFIFLQIPEGAPVGFAAAPLFLLLSASTAAAAVASVLFLQSITKARPLDC